MSAADRAADNGAKQLWKHLKVRPLVNYHLDTHEGNLHKLIGIQLEQNTTLGREYMTKLDIEDCKVMASTGIMSQKFLGKPAIFVFVDF